MKDKDIFLNNYETISLIRGNITENAKIGFEEIDFIKEETDDMVTYQFPEDILTLRKE